MAVTTKLNNKCLTISIDNPPVNALGHKVREGLVAAVKQVEADPTIEAVVLTGAGRFFSAGADITEFGKPPMEPSLPEVLDYLEGCRLPIVAALPGTALGGGLEVALACRYRVALASAKVGLPEVNIGLIPGAGGTQRLPRLIGMKLGAEFVSSGKPVGAQKAFDLGIIDKLVTNDLLQEAMSFAQSLFGTDIRPPLSQAPSPKDWDAEWFDNFVAKTKIKARGQISPVKALEAVRATCTLSFEEGIKREREVFAQCLASEQRAGLIHAFFSEREAAKIPFLKDVAATTVQSIGILGAGTMGAGITIACASAGFEVLLFDTNTDALNAGINRIKKTFRDNVSKGRMTDEIATAAIDRVRPINTLESLENVDLVIEAIIERMDIKQQVFKQLDSIVKPGCVLASNTSYLNIDEIAGATKRPEDVIGMHFFSPANIMKLLEVIHTKKASANSIATAFAVGKKLGKITVLSGVCDGFIGNRILKKYRQQTDLLLEQGAMPDQIDRVIREFGFPMGPFQVADLAGLDIGWHNRRREDATRDPKEHYLDVADTLYEMGRLGQKTGNGWYDYKKGDRTAHPSSIVENLVLKASKDKGIERRDISDEEILEKILNAMVAEGQAILDEGIALKSSDIDLVMIHGYGFPKYRGGLMYYGETNGLLG